MTEPITDAALEALLTDLPWCVDDKVRPDIEALVERMRRAELLADWPRLKRAVDVLEVPADA